MQQTEAYRKVGEKVAGTQPAKASLTALDVALRSQDAIDKSQPIVPVNVDTHPDRIIVRPDGTRHHDWVLTFKRAHVEAMRQGYACLRCWEWQDEPFPAVCRQPLCDYRMGDLQASDFANEFRGVTWVGPTMNMADEQERLRDWVEKDKLEKHERIPGILIPGWAKT